MRIYSSSRRHRDTHVVESVFGFLPSLLKRETASQNKFLGQLIAGLNRRQYRQYPIHFPSLPYYSLFMCVMCARSALS